MREKKTWIEDVAEELEIPIINIDFVNVPQINEWLKQIRHLFIHSTTKEEKTALLTTIYGKLVQFMHETKPHSISSDVQRHAKEFLQMLPTLKEIYQKDVEKTFRGDPSANTRDEVILTYPGIRATVVYRFAHILYKQGYSLLARLLSEYVHKETGIDIHPGAVIGEGFFIDHGTGVVIGETCIIGNNVTLYHGVTLGVLQFERNEKGELIRGTKRHPTIEDNVTIYAEARILGGETVVGKGSVIGSNVMVTKSVPPYSKLVHKPNV